jgi:hypothetical protein
MKNNKGIISILLIAALLIALVATNPKEDRFEQYLKENFKDEGIKKGGFEGFIIEALSGSGAWLLNLGTKSTNYYLFSTYEIKFSDETYTYLGILNNFFELPK